MESLKLILAKTGTVSELCRKLNQIPNYSRVTPQMVNGWERRGAIPVGRVWQIVEATGVPPWEIRSDVYEKPEQYFLRAAKYCTEE